MRRVYTVLQDQQESQVVPARLVRLAIRVLWARTDRLVRRVVLDLKESPEGRAILGRKGLLEFLEQQVFTDLLARPVIKVQPAPPVSQGQLD